MSWKEKALNNFRLYAVTHLTDETPEIIPKIEMAYRGGADIVQLRSKNLTDHSLIRLGLKIRQIATKRHKLYIVNDRLDVALATCADGVHLGQEDLPIDQAHRILRRIGRKPFWIGKSTHSLAQAVRAEKEGADYIGVGPVFCTPTKPEAHAFGLRLVRQVKSKIKIPWVPIGGIDLSNIDAVVKAGATRVAVVRAIFEARNPEQAAHVLRSHLRG